MYLGRIESGKSYKKLYLFFILLSLGLVAAIIYITFGRATVTLSPQKITFENKFDAAVLENPSGAENAVPGKILSLETEESRLVTTNDVKSFDEKAAGTVTIYNQRDKDQPLLSKTRLLSASGVLFRTDRRVVAPAGGKIDVPVTADKEGQSGNIGPQKFTLVNIWTGWQDKLYGESKEAMTGGYVGLPYVYEQTIDQALNILSEQLYAKNLANLQGQIAASEKILSGATKNEILAFSSSIEPETQSDKFTIKVKTRTIALICNEEKLKDLAQKNLKQAAPKDKEFLAIDWNSFSYKLKSYDLEKKEALLETSLSGESRAKISASLFRKNELIGLDRYEIKKYFEKFEDVGSAEVYFKPFWVRKVPSMLDHFEIQIQ